MTILISKSSAVATLALIAFLLIVGPVIPAAYGVGSVAKSSTITVSTGHVTLQLVFPSSADPGQAISVSAYATAKSNGRLVKFSLDISSYTGGQLVRLASRTIVTDTIVRVGDDWQAWLQVVVPTNAQRGPLIGKATEVWQETSYQYYDISYCYQDRNYYPQNYYSQNWQPQNCYRQDNAYQNAYYDVSYCYQDRNYYPQNQQPLNCYPQKQAYYNWYDPYGTQYPQSRNRIITLRTTPQSYAQSCAYRPTYQSSFGCRAAAYYGTNYAGYGGYCCASYPSYAAQVSSQQTFQLTYVLGCCYP